MSTDPARKRLEKRRNAWAKEMGNELRAYMERENLSVDDFLALRISSHVISSLLAGNPVGPWFYHHLCKLWMFCHIMSADPRRIPGPDKWKNADVISFSKFLPVGRLTIEWARTLKEARSRTKE